MAAPSHAGTHIPDQGFEPDLGGPPSATEAWRSWALLLTLWLAGTAVALAGAWGARAIPPKASWWIAPLLSVAALPLWWYLTSRMVWRPASGSEFVRLGILATVIGVVGVGGWFGTAGNPTFERSISVFSGIATGTVMAAVAFALHTRIRTRQLADRIATLTTAKLRAEDRAIRARLNPHFLFNALHSLSWLVRNKPTAASDTIERLGQLLRYVLDDDSADDVPFAREWSFVGNYLAIEQIRLGQRLRFRRTIDPRTLQIPVPSFCLQPLVENAIRHGLSPRPEGGLLTIDVQLHDGSLVIRVMDDGVGVPVADVMTSPGSGLRALRQRLEDRFPGVAQLDLDSAPGEGFAAILTLPVLQDSLSETEHS